MKNIFKILSTAIIATGIFSACSKIDNLKKVEALPVYQLGVSPVLSASTTTVAPTLADTNRTVITFSWTNPKYAQDSSLYKYVLEIDSTGKNFAKEKTRIVTGVRTTSLTGRDLNSFLLQLGFKLNTAQSIDVRLISSYGNNNERYMSNVVKVTVTPFNDPSVLTSTASAVVCAPATQSQLATTFNWSRSFTGYPSPVKYVIEYDSATKNFANLKTIYVGSDTLTKALIQRELNEAGLNCGIVGNTQGKVEFRVKATTAEGAVIISNVVSITITTYPVKLYLVGGSSPAGWTPSAATPFITDPRYPGVFFTYAYLTNAGSGIKFLSENTDWNTPTQVIYGDANGAGNTGNLTTSGGGNNIVVPADGIYRITVDLANSKYYLQTGGIGAVGLVGAFQGWNPGAALKMACFSPNRLILLQNMTNNDEFKFHDGNGWDNSTLNNSRWFDLTSGGNIILNGTPGVSGNNFQWTGATGRVRAIFDYGNVSSPTFVLAAATEMRLVGDGINQAGVNDWDPASSPQMTYSGNGVWTITIALKANKDIKFLAGNAWGAFDYEDNSGQSQATGVDKKIKWEGGDNFKTPATAGTYTITLNEYTQTMKIN